MTQSGQSQVSLIDTLSFNPFLNINTKLTNQALSSKY